jgi:transposase
VNLAEVFREIDALRELVNQLRKRIELLESENTALKAENATLRQRLELNSQTSSLPPSSDGPKKPPPRTRTPSTRKPSGQPKHPGSTLHQIDAPDRTIELVPQTYKCCHAQLDP